MKRYHIIASGRVQGVGFRYFVLLKANTLNLTGTVRNQSNGNVEIFAQGDEEHILKLISELYKGNSFSSVDDISSKEVPLENKEKSFKLVY
ncbi:acylphosphatase [Clostridium sp. UBA1652]|uniref:acylphosphatase n=1 Tax=Clostridium sp. UBA1652 TaxID=1946348 RepID=UPI0025801320|nr:acylphosphatase [Clostridium sp. UBA1652]